jgi:hypothetical protein
MFQIGDRVKFKTGRGWSEGTIVGIGTDQVIAIQSLRHGKILQRKPGNVQKLEPPKHSE